MCDMQLVHACLRGHEVAISAIPLAGMQVALVLCVMQSWARKEATEDWAAFIVQVFHPNIDLEGNVCLNILREDWKPVLSINSVIYGLQFLFLVRGPPACLHARCFSTMCALPLAELALLAVIGLAATA